MELDCIVSVVEELKGKLAELEARLEEIKAEALGWKRKRRPSFRPCETSAESFFQSNAYLTGNDWKIDAGRAKSLSPNTKIWSPV